MKIKIVKFLFSLDTFTLGFGSEAGRTNFGRENLVFSFSNGSLNSLLELGVMFLLYGMNIQCDSF